MEKKIKLQTYKIVKVCPQCEKGSMVSVNETMGALTSQMNPYDHRCDQCGHPETYHRIYPRLEYEEIKDE